VLGAVLLALRRPSLEKVALLGWLAVLVFAYSFWVSGNDRWWWTRFLLPGYAALFFLGAQGVGETRRLLRERWPRAGWARWSSRALIAALAVTPLYYVHFGLEQG